QRRVAAMGVARDGNGNFYVSGFTNSPDFPGIDASLLNVEDFVSFVVKLDAGSMTRLWTRTFGNFVSNLRTDDQGRSAFFIRSPYYTSQQTGVDSFNYIDPAGSALWSVASPGLARALAMDSTGRLYASLNRSGSKSGPCLNNPAAGKLGVAGFMRIDPAGGSLVVLPTHIDVYSYEPLIIGSTSALPFS